MGYPRASSDTSMPTSSFVDVLGDLHSVLPTSENRHMALRFLQHAEFHVRQSLPQDSPFLTESTGNGPTPLTIAKFTLMRILHPAWHSILESCERSIDNWTTSRGIQTFPQQLSWKQNVDDILTHCQRDFLSIGFLHAPPQGSGLPDGGAELKCITPPVDADMCPDLESSGAGFQCASDTANTFTNSSPFASSKIGLLAGPTSTFSALLPEWHCPPFADMTPVRSDAEYTHLTADTVHFQAEGVPSRDNSKVITFHESNAMDKPRDLSEPALALSPRDITASLDGGSPLTTDTSGELPWAAANSPLHASLKMSGPGSSASYYKSETEVQVLKVRTRSKKHKRCTIARPPGLPLGPWTPNDNIPFPSEISPRKPRKVRQPPSHGSSSTPAHGRNKIACPECSALLLPKSLSRHLERHSNWTQGRYDAHLYCRYCFAAYSRMDSLVHHQKTDEQCVQLQYEVYWKIQKRLPRLEGCPRARKTIQD